MKTLGSKIEVEDDFVVATFGFKNGALGTLEITIMQLDQLIMKHQLSILGLKV